MAVTTTLAIHRGWLRRLFRATLCAVLAVGSSGGSIAFAQAPPHSQWAMTNTHVSIDSSSKERQAIQMVVNSSREITASEVFKRVRIQNPNVLSAVPLEGGNRLQISAIATGVTQVDLLGADDSVHTIEVMVLGDVRELEAILRQQFPDANLQVIPVQQGAIVSGYVTSADDVNHVISIAELYFPTVINKVSVTGVHTIQLEAQIMEVSRTKLRELGIDWAFSNGNDVVTQSVGGLLNTVGAPGAGFASTGGETFSVGIVENGSSFFTAIRALRRNNLVKVLASPTLTAIDGRPASFNAGGEFPIPVPAGLGQVGIQYREYGTRLDYVAKVQGNGRISLEVRPYVSEIDYSRTTSIQGTTVPGLRSRYLETAVELGAGQTLALAGLLQVKSETINSGLPMLSDMPYLGALFRTTREEQNEIELLITVTPNFAGPMDPHEVPRNAPGTSTQSPTDKDLYMRGYVETPLSCNNGEAGGQYSPGLIHNTQPLQTLPPGIAPGGQYPGAYGSEGYGMNQPTQPRGAYPAGAPLPYPPVNNDPNAPRLAQRPTMVAQQNYYPQPASAVQPATRPGPSTGVIMR